MEQIRCIRRLRMEHAGNLRDMGGCETGDGFVTAFGKLLRCGSLFRLTDGEWERLKAYGVRTVLDLRSEAEIRSEPDRVPKGVNWFHCPLQPDQIEMEHISESAAKAFAGSLTEGYRAMVTEHGELLSRALRELIRGMDRGAVLFHCTAGKDRTGVLASAVYYLCGVAREDIVADYEVTYTYNKGAMSRLLELLDRETAKELLPLLRSDADNMEQLVALYDQIDLEQYLTQRGLEPGEVQKLRRNFLIPPEIAN